MLLYVLTKNKPSTQRHQNQSMYSHWFWSFFPKCAWPRFGILSPWNWNGLSHLLVRPACKAAEWINKQLSWWCTCKVSKKLIRSSDENVTDPSKTSAFFMALTPPFHPYFLLRKIGRKSTKTHCMLQVRWSSDLYVDHWPPKDLSSDSASHQNTGTHLFQQSCLLITLKIWVFQKLHMSQPSTGDSKHGCF